MIAILDGIILKKKPPYIILDVHGIGYEIETLMCYFEYFPKIQNRISIYIYHVIKKDIPKLFGFTNLDDKYLFKELLKINGVGYKNALSILSNMKNSKNFIQSLINNDINSFIKIPGVGKKIAKRIFIETKNNLKNWNKYKENKKNIISKNLIDSNIFLKKKDAISALISLGYKETLVKKIIKKLEKKIYNLTTSEVIKIFLKNI